MSRFSFILWVILLIGIWLKWRYRWPPEKAAVYQCAHDTLVINHQIIANDLAGNDDNDDTDAYVGKYLLTAKKSGDTIRLKDLASNPIIPPVAKDSAIVILPLRDNETLAMQTLDAGAYIYLIAAVSDSLSTKSILASNPVTAIKVIAVHHAIKETPGNWLWLQFPVTSNVNVAAFAAAQKRIIAKAAE